jgi:hypothetical protein
VQVWRYVGPPTRARDRGVPVPIPPCRQVSRSSQNLRPQRCGDAGIQSAGEVGADQAAQHIAAPPRGQAGIAGHNGEELPWAGSDDARNTLQQYRGATLLRRRRRRRPRVELAGGRERGEQGTELARMRSKDHRAISAQRDQCARSTGKGDQSIGIEHDRFSRLDQGGDECPPPRIATQSGADHHSIGFGDELEQRGRSRLVEALNQRLHIGLGLHERCDRVRRRHRVHQPGSGTKRGPCGQPESAAHSGRTTDDYHSSPGALVVAGVEPAHPLCRLQVTHHDGPPRIGRRMSDVYHGEVAHFVSGQQVPPPESAEGDSEISARRSVDDAGQQIDPGRPIYSHNGDLEIVHPSEKSCYRWTRGAGGAGAEQRVNRQPDCRPRAVGRDLSHPFGPGQRGHLFL